MFLTSSIAAEKKLFTKKRNKKWKKKQTSFYYSKVILKDLNTVLKYKHKNIIGNTVLYCI